MREYITDNGEKIMLPITDERVMTLDELAAKYAAKKSVTKTQLCPKCHTYCYGDCDNK